ncbi:hypothetical protein LWI29_027842 [Acer saccharum]|uniref:Retrotransposon gag domain-containing protein n=1 Tax=Acer saccharum TaxID=4024 RepID=A0AA39RDV4_ACESA|nr:hypothetical protein LWI29_027842 [Acer saccharum]
MAHQDPVMIQVALNNLTRPLKDFTIPRALDQPLCITLPNNNVNFEIKSGIIHLLPQFYGKPEKDPHIHIKDFFAVCATILNGGASDEEIWLRLFPFSLKEKAKEWFYSLPSASITTWVELASKFLAKFFPAQRTNRIRKEITGVQQLDNEPFHEYWECFQRLLNSCPHHGVQDWLLMQYFYKRLLDSERLMVDATSGGGLMNKNALKAKEIFEILYENSQQFNYQRTLPRKANAYEESCTVLGGYMEEMAQENYMQQINNPFSNIYNQGWHQYPQPPMQNQFMPQQSAPQPPPQQGKSLDELIESLALSTQSFVQEMRQSINDVENQIRQITILLNQRDQGRLPSQVIQNPRGNMESCKEITLQSGEEFANGEEEESEAKEEDEGHEFFLGSLATQTVIQGCTEALLIEPEPQCFPSYGEMTLRTIETIHMVEEIPPFRDKRKLDEKNNKEKKTFIDKIRNEKKADTLEVNDFSKVPEPD